MPEPKKVAAAAPGPGVAEAEELARRNANPAAHTAHVIGQGCKACEERIRVLETELRAWRVRHHSDAEFKAMHIRAETAEAELAEKRLSDAEWERACETWKARAEKAEADVKRLKARHGEGPDPLPDREPVLPPSSTSTTATLVVASTMGHWLEDDDREPVEREGGT